MKYSALLFVFISVLASAQSTAQRLEKQVQSLLNSSSAYAANLSFYVADANGNLVYENGGRKGLSSASTQKIFTAGAALESLGTDFKWKTTLSYDGQISNDVLNGSLYVFSNGDPTLGSWRYSGHKPEDFEKAVVGALLEKGIKKVSGDLWIDDSHFDFQTIPGGWPWNDLGNYYGAGVFGVNWRENQFDMRTSGKEIRGFNIDLQGVKWVNDLKAGGSSDQSLVFTAPFSNVAYINGTLPNKSMTVSGVIPNPPLQLGVELQESLKKAGIELDGKIRTSSLERIETGKKPRVPRGTLLLEYKSPSLEEVVYYFMRKSVNLYGEALVKTLAKEKTSFDSFEGGIGFMKDFWKSIGINSRMINFADGSGLSPQNYVSAEAEVKALLWSKKQGWFDAFYKGFPVQGNGMKMKSGTMKNTKSFAGYHRSASGKEYVFAIILNNYQGGNISQALYDVLSPLK